MAPAGAEPARGRLSPTALVLVGLALASAVALVWPSLPWSGAGSEVPARAGVVVRTIDLPGGSEPRVNGVAPDFEWVTPAGELKRLTDLRGSTVVINFWATWCEPCLEEMPALDRVAASEPQLTVLALDLDESADKVDGFIDSYGLTHIVPVIDAGKKVFTSYGVVSLPSTFFIAPDGRVKHLEIRGMDERVIREGLLKARR